MVILILSTTKSTKSMSYKTVAFCSLVPFTELKNPRNLSVYTKATTRQDHSLVVSCTFLSEIRKQRCYDFWLILQDANPKGTISLDGEGISVILTGQRDRLGFHFKLKTPERIYPLIAEDEQQRELWIKAIHQSCYQGNLTNEI